MLSVGSLSPYVISAQPGSAVGPARQASAPQSSASDSSPPAAVAATSGSLSSSAQSKVDQLKEIDRKVKAHEQAHIAAGGELIRGGANFSYQKGPDGKLYAIGGDVSIDTSPGRTPEDTVVRAQRIRSAALAPADPSAQDRRVAADASAMELSARGEVAASKNTESTAGDNGEVASSAVSNAVAEKMVALYAAVSRSGDQTSTFSDAA
jgi:hypothetical protein